MLFFLTLLEFIYILLWTGYLFNRCTKKWWGLIVKTLLLSVFLLLSAILGGQLSSLYSTGHYIDVLTLSNLDAYKDVGWKIFISSAIIILICLALTVAVAFTAKNSWYSVIRWPILMYCLFFWCINPQGALFNFGKTYTALITQNCFSPDAKLRQFQQQLYGKEDTFVNDADVSEILDLRNKNIVVVFAEGFSAQWIDKFNQYKSLTPNLDRFLEQAIYFDNYYNHTAATFRGLRGQLTSSYQYRGGVMVDKKGLAEISDESIRKSLSGRLVSIPHILKDNGYHSYFLVAHHNNYPLNQMLQTLEFDNVYGADDFLNDNSGKDLTDQQIFYGLSGLINSNKLDEPYFIGMYNVGTHLGQDSPDVKYGDGQNSLLNTIRNFDDAFGKFWDTVKDQKDLVIIFTADHAAYPSGLYNQTFKTNRQYFVDKIPFAIWSHGLKSMVMDAYGRNSLDFAPTLLQSMGIKHAFNYFLGCSLFGSDCPRKFEYLHCEGGWCLQTPTLRVLDSEKAEDLVELQEIKNFYNLSEDRNSN